MGAADLPLARAGAIAKAFERDGWVKARQRGSHVVMTKQGHRANLTIPDHGGRDVKRNLLAGLVKAAGLTNEQFLDLFNR